MVLFLKTSLSKIILELNLISILSRAFPQKTLKLLYSTLWYSIVPVYHSYTTLKDVAT